MERFFHATVRRYYELDLPRGKPPHGGWPLLIALHGYQGDKDSMMRIARRIAAGRMVVISLQGPNQFFAGYGDNPKNYRVGFGWGTTWKMEESVERHDADLHLLIRHAVRKYRAAMSKVFLLAFSQACSYNYRFVFTRPTLARGAVGVCGGIPSDWETNPRYCRATTHVLHIAATHDVWYPKQANLRFREQLAQRAASVDFRFYKSAHRFPRRAIPYIRKWIQEHLVRPAKRLDVHVDDSPLNFPPRLARG